MDITYEYLWSAGYLLPAELHSPKPADKPAAELHRRGKKAAKAKRRRAKS